MERRSISTRIIGVPEPFIRYLPFAVVGGPQQMAADEVMLESAVGGIASLRFYQWDPPTLSLGYFQKREERLRDPKLARMDWIRRATGGGAIIHDNDLTYAIALPRTLCRGKTPAEWHCRVHHILAGLLRDRRVAAEVVGGCRAAQGNLDFLCFAVPQPGDVVWEAKKIIGGAQRVRAGALVQHGSIQLPDMEGCADELAQGFADALGWRLEKADWTDGEKSRIETLAAEKYGHASWNEKR